MTKRAKDMPSQSLTMCVVHRVNIFLLGRFDKKGQKVVTDKTVNTTNLKINGSAKSEQVASLGADLIGTNVLRLYSERKQDLFGSSHK